MSDALAAAASTAAAANEVACYDLVQLAQSWLQQMQVSASSAPPPGAVVKLAAATAAVSAHDAAAPTPDAAATTFCDGSGGNSSISILLDLWKQGQEIHAQYMVPHPRSHRPQYCSCISFASTF
jgi:hypothetical protein